jgi:peptide-methionine (S)-S-oxide reductase
MAIFGFGKKVLLPQPEEALPGRATPMPVPEKHYVNGARLTPPFPEGMELAMFGMGCFWGAERKFWQMPGVYSTAVGYAAGFHAQSHLSGSVYGDDGAQRSGAGGV